MTCLAIGSMFYYRGMAPDDMAGSVYPDIRFKSLAGRTKGQIVMVGPFSFSSKGNFTIKPYL